MRQSCAIIAGDFQFLRRPADGEVIDKNLPLDGTVRHPPQFSELQIAEMLHPDPYSGPKHSQHQAQACRPVGHSKKQAE